MTAVALVAVGSDMNLLDGMHLDARPATVR
jgi:hypothetical protein